MALFSMRDSWNVWRRKVNLALGGIIDGIDASEVDYSNTSSGLTATNVQSAIDELTEDVTDINNVNIGKETIVRISLETNAWQMYGSDKFDSTTTLQDILTYFVTNHVKADRVKIYTNSNSSAFNQSLPITTGALVEIVCIPYTIHGISGWDRGYVKLTNFRNGDTYIASINDSTIGSFKKISFTS